MVTERKSGLAHCCHHYCHWEYCYDFDKRVYFIKTFKPKKEQELRLRLFQLVPDDLLPGKNSPEWYAINKTVAVFSNAMEDYEKMPILTKPQDAFLEARDAYIQAEDAYIAKYQPELDTLHDKLFPDCTWNGKTIFGHKRR